MKTHFSDVIQSRVTVAIAWSLAHLSPQHEAEYRRSLRLITEIGRRDEEMQCSRPSLALEVERSDIRQAYAQGVEMRRSALARSGVRPFDLVLWDRQCDQFASQALRGSGHSDVLWSRFVTMSVRPLLKMVSADHERLALQIAVAHGYMTEQDEEEQNRMINESGLCHHGFDEDTCPCGCFED